MADVAHRVGEDDLRRLHLARFVQLVLHEVDLAIPAICVLIDHVMKGLSDFAEAPGDSLSVAVIAPRAGPAAAPQHIPAAS